jgi:hypothetical protein
MRSYIRLPVYVVSEPLLIVRLGADVAPNPPVRVVEEADDGGLFAEGWQCQPQGLELRAVDVHDDEAAAHQGFLCD